jgi:hypothetical protein
MSLLRHCWVAFCLCVCAQAGGLVWAAERPEVWVALAEPGGSYLEVAGTLRAETDSRRTRPLEWVIAPASELLQREGTPAMVVTVGAGAWRELAQRFVSAPPPMLATLLPRVAFEQGMPWKTRPRQVSAVLLDQPPTRQINLIKHLAPRRKLETVGLLLGPDSRRYAREFQLALTEAGLTALPVEVSDAAGVSTAVIDALKGSDVLLAVPDPLVFNSGTISAILLSSYRWLVPLVGYSPAMVKSGALAAVYATPAHVAKSAADAVLDALAGRALPPPRAPAEFSIAINPSVARSMGLQLEEATLLRALVAHEHGVTRSESVP